MAGTRLCPDQFANPCTVMVLKLAMAVAEEGLPKNTLGTCCSLQQAGLAHGVQCSTCLSWQSDSCCSPPHAALTQLCQTFPLQATLVQEAAEQALLIQLVSSRHCSLLQVASLQKQLSKQQQLAASSQASEQLLCDTREQLEQCQAELQESRQQGAASESAAQAARTTLEQQRKAHAQLQRELKLSLQRLSQLEAERSCLQQRTQEAESRAQDAAAAQQVRSADCGLQLHFREPRGRCCCSRGEKWQY